MVTLEETKGELSAVVGGWEAILKASQFVENQAELLYVSDKHVNSMSGTFTELLNKKIKLEYRLRNYLAAIVVCSKDGDFDTEIRKIVARNTYCGYRDQLTIVSSQIEYLKRQAKLRRANLQQEQLAIVEAGVENEAEKGELSESLPF